MFCTRCVRSSSKECRGRMSRLWTPPTRTTRPSSGATFYIPGAGGPLIIITSHLHSVNVRSGTPPLPYSCFFSQSPSGRERQCMHILMFLATQDPFRQNSTIIPRRRCDAMLGRSLGVPWRQIRGSTGSTESKVWIDTRKYAHLS